MHGNAYRERSASKPIALFDIPFRQCADVDGRDRAERRDQSINIAHRELHDNGRESIDVEIFYLPLHDSIDSINYYIVIFIYFQRYICKIL